MADSKLLADIIVKNIREEFQAKHLSGNLADTIRVEKYSGSDGVGYNIFIPAETYDIKEFSKTSGLAEYEVRRLVNEGKLVTHIAGNKIYIHFGKSMELLTRTVEG